MTMFFAVYTVSCTVFTNYSINRNWSILVLYFSVWIPELALEGALCFVHSEKISQGFQLFVAVVLVFLKFQTSIVEVSNVCS